MSALHEANVSGIPVVGATTHALQWTRTLGCVRLNLIQVVQVNLIQWGPCRLPWHKAGQCNWGVGQVLASGSGAGRGTGQRGTEDATPLVWVPVLTVVAAERIVATSAVLMASVMSPRISSADLYV